MTTVEYLNQYKYARIEIDALREEAQEIKKQLQEVSLTFGGDGSNTAPNIDKIPRAFEKIDLIEREITARIGALAEVRMEINTVIQSVSDERLKTLLVCRYIAGESFEKIASEMGYTYNHVVMRLHPEALKCVEGVRNGVQ